MGAEAEATKCSKDSALSASAGALAEAMARAYAEAVVKVDAFCETTENSSACVWAEASQEKMAAVRPLALHARPASMLRDSGAQSTARALVQAQARAFASAWARANSGCGCEVSLDATADAIESIYASATAEVLAEVCSDGAAGSLLLAPSGRLTLVAWLPPRRL